LRQSTGDTS